MISFNIIRNLIIFAFSFAETLPRWEGAKRKPFDKVNRFSYPKTMRELDTLAPSDFSENCPVPQTPDFSFIA